MVLIYYYITTRNEHVGVVCFVAMKQDDSRINEKERKHGWNSTSLKDISASFMMK
jgi:hypothetical protein